MSAPMSVLLRRARLEWGWSQREFAARLSAAGGGAPLSRHEVSRWERGARVPGVWWRRRLAAVLGVPEETLTAAAAAERRAPEGPVDSAPTEAALRMLAALGIDRDVLAAREVLAAAVARQLPTLAAVDVRAVLTAVAGAATVPAQRAGSEHYERDEAADPGDGHGAVVVDGSGRVVDAATE